jgi:hypothetical protein
MRRLHHLSPTPPRFMRIAFGLLSLVVVLAVVGLSAKRALQASSAPASAMSDAATRSPQAVTRKVAEDVGQLMQQAASRAEGGDR